MSKNKVEPERTQTIWRLRVSCWISKATRAQACARALAPTTTYPPKRTHAHKLMPSPAHACTHTHTHTEICNAYCFSTATVVSWTCLIVTLSVHCLSCLSQNHAKHGRISLRLDMFLILIYCTCSIIC